MPRRKGKQNQLGGNYKPAKADSALSDARWRGGKQPTRLAPSPTDPVDGTIFSESLSYRERVILGLNRDRPALMGRGRVVGIARETLM
jgi:hypothetical protein